MTFRDQHAAIVEDPSRTSHREPFLCWPGGDHLRYFAFLALAQTIWFGLIYGGADFLTARRTLRLQVHLKVEEKLPFIPAAVVIYVSIYILFCAIPFILQTRRQLKALAITQALVTLCGGICFLLFPAELDFPVPRDLGMCAGLFRFADWQNLNYNQVPSLHVALSVVCVAAFASRAAATGKIFLWLWVAAISVSAVLTYQHHILDVISGFILGILATKLVYNRLATSKLDT